MAQRVLLALFCLAVGIYAAKSSKNLSLDSDSGEDLPGDALCKYWKSVKEVNNETFPLIPEKGREKLRKDLPKIRKYYCSGKTVDVLNEVIPILDRCNKTVLEETWNVTCFQPNWLDMIVDCREVAAYFNCRASYGGAVCGGAKEIIAFAKYFNVQFSFPSGDVCRDELISVMQKVEKVWSDKEEETPKPSNGTVSLQPPKALKKKN